jgi:hypothetical protein
MQGLKLNNYELIGTKMMFKPNFNIFRDHQTDRQGVTFLMTKSNHFFFVEIINKNIKHLHSLIF